MMQSSPSAANLSSQLFNTSLADRRHSIFQLSADARDLGRTYPTKLSVRRRYQGVPSTPLLPILVQRTQATPRLTSLSARPQSGSTMLAHSAQPIAAAEFDAPVTTPLVEPKMAHAIGPDVAIVDRIRYLWPLARLFEHHIQLPIFIFAR